MMSRKVCLISYQNIGIFLKNRAGLGKNMTKRELGDFRMEDIDRTFEKLKRLGFKELLIKLRNEGKLTVVVDPHTFMPLPTVHPEYLIGTGWTMSDFREARKLFN